MPTQSPVPPLINAVLLVVVLALTAFGLTQATVSADEAQNLWMVRDVAAPDAGLREALRVDLREAFERVQTGPQPPVYAAALDVWTTLFGAEIVTARALSAVILLLALGVVALWARVAQAPVGLAVLIAAALGIYAGTQAAIHAAVLFASAWSTLVLTLFCRRPNVLRGLLYLITAGIVLYTAHVAPVITLLHAFIAWRAGIFPRWIVAFALAVLGFFPWLVLFQSADVGNFDPVTVAVSWGMVLAPVVAIEGARRFADNRLVIMGGVGVVAVLSVAWTLFIYSGTPDEINEIQALRADNQPALTHFDPRQRLNYYDTQSDTRLSTGLAIDLSWREQMPETLALALTAVETAPSVWIMIPAELDLVNTLTELLSEGRVIGYDETIGGVRFIRFDRE